MSTSPQGNLKQSTSSLRNKEKVQNGSGYTHRLVWKVESMPHFKMMEGILDAMRDAILSFQDTADYSKPEAMSTPSVMMEKAPTVTALAEAMEEKCRERERERA